MSYKNESNSYVKDKSPAKILGPDHVKQRHNRNASKTKQQAILIANLLLFEIGSL